MIPIRILLVEDKATERADYIHFIQHAKRIAPHDMEIVGCGSMGDADALVEARKATGNQFDVAMLDLGLPDSDRDDTIENLISIKARWSVLIFILTGCEEIEYRDRCLAMGADEFTTKAKIFAACGCVLERIYNLVIKERLLHRFHNER